VNKSKRFGDGNNVYTVAGLVSVAFPVISKSEDERYHVLAKATASQLQLPMHMQGPVS